MTLSLAITSPAQATGGWWSFCGSALLAESVPRRWPRVFAVSACIAAAWAGLLKTYATKSTALVRDVRATALSATHVTMFAPCGLRMVFAAVVRCQYHRQVFDSIVALVAIQMMDMLKRLKRSAKVLLHDDAMFQHVSSVLADVRIACSFVYPSGGFVGGVAVPRESTADPLFGTGPATARLRYLFKARAYDRKAYAAFRTDCISSILDWCCHSGHYSGDRRVRQGGLYGS